MAANPFTMYESAKRYLADGTIDMDTNTITARIARSISNASTSTLSLSSEITNWVTDGAFSSKILNISFDENGSSIKVSADNLVWTASGGGVATAKFLVVSDGTSDKLICWAALTTGSIVLAQDATLTVNLDGIFNMD